MPRATLYRYLTLILLLLLAAAAAFFLFETETGRQLRQHHVVLRFVHSHPLLAPVVFILIYVAAGLLLLPVWWLQLLAGHCFGLFMGILWCQIASTISAMAAHQLSGWLMGPWIHDKLEARREKLRKIDERLGHNGLLVVAAVRLIHLIPFGLSNYLFGLTRISLIDVGIGTFVAGTATTTVWVATGWNRHMLTNWRFLGSVALLNLILLTPVLLRYIRPEWFKKIGVE